ncbi:hypothetical protein GS944_17770 [Rhodococcus hoagii]|nr:hypothetical protein [Prescottella equi]
MLAAHTAATVVCAGLVLGAERLYGPITRVLRAVWRHPSWVSHPHPCARRDRSTAARRA